MNVDRALIVMTPRTAARLAGERDSLRRAASAAFARSEWIVSNDPARVHARVLEFDPEVIVAAGGDGTVNLVLQAMRADDALAVLPLGTANDLATFLGVARDPEQLALVLREARRIDCLRVNGRRFCTTGGLGLPADVADRVNALHNADSRNLLARLGSQVYPLVAARQCAGGPPRYRLELRWEPPDGRVGSERRIEVETHGLFVTNQARFARRLQVVDGADNADGQFEICIMLARGRGPLLRLLWHIMNHRIRADECRILRCRRATIHVNRIARFFGDGEILARSRDFELDLDVAGLRLLS